MHCSLTQESTENVLEYTALNTRNQRLIHLLVIDNRCLNTQLITEHPISYCTLPCQVTTALYFQAPALRRNHPPLPLHLYCPAAFPPLRKLKIQILGWLILGM